MLTYGRLFAEFLSGRSLVPLGLLALPTCVGLRYDMRVLNLEVFVGRVWGGISSGKPEPYQNARRSLLKAVTRICLDNTTERSKRQTIKAHHLISSVSPSHKRAWAGILTGFPSAAALASAFGSPNSGRIPVFSEMFDYRAFVF